MEKAEKSNSAPVWSVVENPGMYNQVTVFEGASYKECKAWIKDAYMPDDIDQLNPDILRDGSTEY